MATWRQSLIDAVAFLEEQGIYGQQAEYIAKEILRIGEKLQKQSRPWMDDDFRGRR